MSNSLTSTSPARHHRAWVRVAGPVDADLTAIADWARTARAEGTRNRGIVVDQGGRIVAHTIYSARPERVDAWYVDCCDAAPEVVSNVLDMSLGQIRRACAPGTQVVHLTFGELCLGTGR